MKPAARQIMKRVHAGTVLGALVALYVGFYLVQTVQHNYQLQQQISQLNGQISDQQTQNATLKYQIQYYQTGDYQEKEARAKLGLQAPGEGVILLPQSGADSSQPQPTPTAKPAPKQSNWQQWVSFLQGRS